MRKTKNIQCKYKTYQLSLGIRDHDLQYRAKNAVKYLNKTNQVYKIWLTIKLRGRAVNYSNAIPDIFQRFINFCDGKAIQEGPILQKGNIWSILLKNVK